MKQLKVVMARSALCMGILCAAPAAHAGIPVIDVAAIVQAVLQVLSGDEEIANQVTQIANEYSQIANQVKEIESMTGSRGLGSVLNNGGLQNYVPKDANQVYSAIASDGYGGLSASGRTLRDSRMTYNCMDLSGDRRNECQADLASPYQDKAFMQDALAKARNRTDQINALMDQANSTDDQKSVLEIQARIAAEQALLQHETTQISLAQGIATANERIAQSRAQEGQLEQTTRTRRLADFITAP